MATATLTYQLPEEQDELEAALMGAESVRVLRTFEQHLMRELRDVPPDSPESKALRRVWLALRNLQRGKDVDTSSRPLEDDGTPHEEDDSD